MTDRAAIGDEPARGQHLSTTAARHQWEASAASVLRAASRLNADAPDADVWDRLGRRGIDGVTVPPLATAVDVATLPTTASLAVDPGQPPFLRGSRAAAAWDVRVHIDDRDPARARRAAQDDLTGGAHSLWLDIDAADLAAVLDGVDVATVPLVLAGTDPDAGEALAALATARGTALHPNGSLGVDPIGAQARLALATAPQPAGNVPDVAATTLAAAELAGTLGIGAIVVDGAVAHHAGASDAQEIGYSLAVGAAYLRLLTAGRMNIDEACRLISFRYAVTDEQFTQIAKLRAARLAWARVCELSGATPAARVQRQHAVTSAAMLTRYDRHTNLLRGTVATFAAAVGGADAITTLPFDIALGQPDAFARRMARNVSALLTGESGLDIVADPAGGAAAVEVLTDRLAEAGWREFSAIEQAGGVEAALTDGSIARDLATSRAERYRRIATRRAPITGVSEFPDANESAADLPPAALGALPTPLNRWAEPFERLRDAPPERPLLLVRVGTEAAASARMTFTRNLLAAGGVAVTIVPVDDLGPIDAPAAMLVGSDRDYAAHAAETVATLRTAGVNQVFIAGRPAGLDVDATSVAAGDDVLVFLDTVRAALGGAR